MNTERNTIQPCEELILSIVATQMSQEDMMVSEISEAEKAEEHAFSFIHGS